MSRVLILLAVLVAAGCGYAAWALAPRAVESADWLSAQEDPVRLTDLALDKTFTMELAAREVDAALKAGDPDLAKSFLDLASDRRVPVDPALAARVAEALGPAASTKRGLMNFARGFVVGEPDDMVGLAGTTVGDLFVFGDIRDAVREGSRMASGEEADELVLGLACIGLAVTAGTYATVGAGTPARVGLSLVKAARKTGRMSAHLGDWMSRSVREVVDWSALRGAYTKASITDPALAVRAAREAVKVGKSDEIVRVIGDIGRVQARAGTGAALDSMKLARGPADTAKFAKLAEKKGNRTRAILKTLGRGAIALTLSTFNLALWIFWVLAAVFGFVSSCKTTAERCTLRYCRRRRERRRLADVPHFSPAPA